MMSLMKTLENYFEEYEEIVTTFLQDMGLPKCIQGFGILRTAVIMTIANRGILDNPGRELYPRLAVVHETTGSRAERALRHAISVVWERGNQTMNKEIFGYSASLGLSIPTNVEFIRKIVYKILQDGNLRALQKSSVDTTARADNAYNKLRKLNTFKSCLEIMKRLLEDASPNDSTVQKYIDALQKDVTALEK